MGIYSLTSWEISAMFSTFTGLLARIRTTTENVFTHVVCTFMWMLGTLIIMIFASSSCCTNWLNLLFTPCYLAGVGTVISVYLVARFMVIWSAGDFRSVPVS